MITKQDLQEAIAECQGQRNPNANTCIKLAAYFILLDHMADDTPERYSYSSAPSIAQPVVPSVEYWSDSDFGRAVNGKSVEDVLPLVDELMQTIQVLQPKIYDAVLRKLE